MKLYCFYLLILTWLTIGTAIAQPANKNTTTISRLKAKTNFNRGVDNRLVDSSCFQYTGDRSFNAKLNTWAFDRSDEYNMLTSVPTGKTRTIQTFNNAGNLISSESERYNSASSLWQKQEKNSYTYSNSGQLTEKVVEYWDPQKAVWVKSFKSSMTYSNNLVADSTLQAWDGSASSWTNIHKTVWTYDNQNRIEKMLVNQYKQGSWQNYQAQIYSYGTPVNKAYYIDLQIPDTITRWTSIYDANGKIAEIEFERKAAKKWDPTFKVLNTYDAVGNLAEELRQEYSFGNYENQERKLITYNIYNQILILTPERWDGSKI